MAYFVPGIAEIVKTDTIQDHAQRIMFMFDDLRGEGFIASFAKVKLDSFMLLLAPAALNHFPTLAIRATVRLNVWHLARVMPEQVEVAAGFYSFGFGFDGHMVGGHLTIWGWAI